MHKIRILFGDYIRIYTNQSSLRILIMSLPIDGEGSRERGIKPIRNLCSGLFENWITTQT
jgi:hypothetical protein